MTKPQGPGDRCLLFFSCLIENDIFQNGWINCFKFLFLFIEAKQFAKFLYNVRVIWTPTTLKYAFPEHCQYRFLPIISDFIKPNWYAQT